ncbi:MAG: DUF2442 domain-containing protein [Bacteroidales bacterium]|nr:DUF2442 domain-containing protein [Bacteroidales bacterium]MCL2738406.1 DUF2442 domain-containing protein [Bacteroidales bacterium]
MKTVIKVWVDDSAVYIQTTDGKVFSRLFADFPLLRTASPTQRADFKWGKMGIRWEGIDEDLSYAGFFKSAQPPRSAHLNA